MTESLKSRQRIKVLTWHVHSSYLLYLTQADCDFYLPIMPGKYEGKGAADRPVAGPQAGRECASLCPGAFRHPALCAGMGNRFPGCGSAGPLIRSCTGVSVREAVHPARE
jgi:hypothetical protein